MRFRGENPIYRSYGQDYRREYSSEYTATYGGVFRKTTLLLLLAGLIAYYVGTTTIEFSIGMIIGSLIVAPLLAYIMVWLAHSSTNYAFLFSILYAILQGVFLGVISLMYTYYAGGEPIVIYALVGTFGTVFVMLLVYTSGLVRVGEGFKGFLYTAFGTLMLITFVYMILYFTGVLSFAGSGLSLYMSIIAFSIFVSTLYLLYDFNQVQEMVEAGVDKQVEWSLSLGLIVVIIWLYVDILRLLAIIMRRD